MSNSLAGPTVDAVMSTAAKLLGMEVVFMSGISEEHDEFRFNRVYGEWPGITPGTCYPRSDSLCHRMLGGASPSTADTEGDPGYADAPARVDFGIRSYVGVPVHDDEGRVVATLCGIDHRSVEVSEDALSVLRELAGILSAHASSTREGVVIRRTSSGWNVDGSEADDLLSAMVLADLLAGELRPGARPPRPPSGLDEVAQLRVSVAQLEHALAARVVVEQAIGVLTERQRTSPRESFERLRRIARSRGRKVHDLARDVVASANNPRVSLPPELAAAAAQGR